jgi:signal transduction histidine kinase
VPVDSACLSRFGTDGTVTLLGAWTRPGHGRTVPLGRRLVLVPPSSALQVLETGLPARIEDAAGRRSVVAAPIVVGGRLWGVVHVASTWDRPLPADIEERLLGFTELAATALSNAKGRAELEASRARVMATADAARRRMGRDLHDGVQQRLLSLAREVRAARAATPDDLVEHRAELTHLADRLERSLGSIREIALGLHPAILADGGLVPALRTLAGRSAIPVDLDVRVEGRLPDALELTAYYVVSEALTNTAKHARASRACVSAEAGDGVLRVAVRDDGRGGADLGTGSGLLGLKDRVEAIGGRLALESPPGAGTALTVELPLGSQRASR